MQMQIRTSELTPEQIAMDKQDEEAGRALYEKHRKQHKKQLTWAGLFPEQKKRWIEMAKMTRESE